jgi:acyl-CoA synthetase (AMP-forming)/AMP-acid ligase II
MIEFLLERFARQAGDEAVVWNDSSYTYGWLIDRIREWQRTITQSAIATGSVVAIEADFSPSSVALFLALIERRCVLVPLTSSVETKKTEFQEIAQIEVSVQIDAADQTTIVTRNVSASHPYYQSLREAGHPGLVLFSSGSTGKSKAAVHDLISLLEKFKVVRHKRRTIPFLLFDHIGGVNTMLYSLSNGGCLITVRERSPDRVLRAVEQHRADLLPASPTFLNLVLLSEAYKRHTIATLQTITYGTEPMPESTLKRFHELFPGITLLQTYGLSEVGILRSKSKSSNSLWVKVGGEGFSTRVVDGILQIKAQSAMLGYLNASNPFTADGWFNTGDSVEVDGEYIKILGRKSEIITVGGEKVYPAEVESVIQEVRGVAEVTVYGEVNLIMGHLVCAKIRLVDGLDVDRGAFLHRLKLHCRERMQAFKVPTRLRLEDGEQYSARFKKMRNIDA